MTEDQARDLLAEIQANAKALKACQGPHEFVDATPDRMVGKRFRCARCGGTAGSIEVAWYRAGVAHGVRG